MSRLFFAALTVAGGAFAPLLAPAPAGAPNLNRSWVSKVLPNRNFTSTAGGRNRARTCDPLLVRQVLYQLSYSPETGFLARSRSEEGMNTQ